MLLKKQLRRQMRLSKAQVADAQKQVEADVVFAALERMPEFETASSVLLYYSLPDELPTHRVLQQWCRQKTIYLPRVSGDDLEIVLYDGNLNDDNPFHIAEPVGPSLDIVPPLVIVPAVALDSFCHRMGRGRGYYDRLLSQSRAFTVGVALDCQLVTSVPCEPHDKALDAVVTAATGVIYRCPHK